MERNEISRSCTFSKIRSCIVEGPEWTIPTCSLDIEYKLEGDKLHCPRFFLEFRSTDKVRELTWLDYIVKLMIQV